MTEKELSESLWWQKAVEAVGAVGVVGAVGCVEADIYGGCGPLGCGGE